MYLNGFSYVEISEILNVSQSFVEKWRAKYNKEGAACFELGYKGTTSEVAILPNIIWWILQKKLLRYWS